MARQRQDIVYRPGGAAQASYERLYGLYRKLADGGGAVADVMRELRHL
jgi:hypothetical protein